ncbi:pyocin knob domain-containing protein [Paenibacillus polymyxa]|uniref:pyocin knob domain-containing protein n=1 Tax=Paenibacillus TaxID=44249 RepID=UPI00142D507F|nr:MULTISPECIES: pyocin knob domain-containing protein [Paenibacillus]KAF6658855.1 tail fiber protein [Paenibacillus sp. EKM301P]UBS85384.1 pyocin knob domain-containing protein [Paenibacillus polymyxa]WHX33900.1 pyocin knob domain-containing protein [Paenibacillus polymyxa]
MANTDKLSLPLIEPNMTADVPRDMNALAEAVDARVGVAGGLAVLGADGKVPADQLNVKDPVDASLTQKGIVQLSNAISDTSQIKAVTPYALKTVYDLAVAGMRLRNVNNGTNLDTLTQIGVYRIVEKSKFPNAPDDYGILQVNSDTPGYITQTFITVLTAKMYTRGRNESGAWTGWNEVALSPVGDVRSPMVFRGQVSGDFNNYNQTGYYIVASDNWTGVANFPRDNTIGNAYPYGVLEVINSGQGLNQLYRQHSDSRVWTRGGYNNGSWAGWKRLLTTDDYDTLFQLSVDTKGQVATAINGKGGNANSSMTGAQLAAAILGLPVKRFAKGTFNGQSASSSSTTTGASMNVGVNTMNFSPTRVFIRLRLKDSYGNLYIEGIAMAGIPYDNDVTLYGRFQNRVSIYSISQSPGGFTATINSTEIRDYAGGGSIAVIEAFEWFAYE